ncbi:MAG: tetraacyldisaccharide 4'-kinase [Thermodesulfobacteriota bacterium]
MAVDWSRIHASRSFSALTLPLAACSFFYGLGVRLDRARHHRLGADRLPGLVVSIGGLTAGGAGKTPAAAALARWALGRGRQVAVLSRGYGRKRGGPLVVVSDRDRIRADVAEAGDEPLMLAGMLPGVPVVVSRRRSLAGRLARREWGSDFFILDDGFQHWAVERDLDVVLLDAADPVGNGRLLPWGPLREPISALERADVVVLTRSNPDMKGREPADTLLERFPGLPCVRSMHVPSVVAFPGRGLEHPAGYLQGRRVAAFCGIAGPGVFRETLASLGAEVAVFRPFRDHHLFTQADVKEMVGLFRESGADALITTEKDWMRAGAFLAGEQDAGFLRITMEFHSGADVLFDMIGT